MQILQAKFPKWIMRGCLAHALNALMKDICVFTKGIGQNAMQNRFGLQWAETVVMLCSKVANFFQDSGTAKAKLNEEQVTEYGARGTIVVPAPTRWASNFLVVKCILENRKALQTCVRTQGWTEGFGGDALLTAELISDLAENTWKRQRNAQQPFYFWEKVTLWSSFSHSQMPFTRSKQTCQ